MVLFEKILTKEEETGSKAVRYRQNQLGAPHKSDKLSSSHLSHFYVVAAVKALAVRIKVSISINA